MEGFSITESRTSSKAYAPELTRQKEETPILEFEGTESTSTEWTDEKHSLYLKSMEASFVNQMYDSVNLLGWNSQKEKLQRPKSSRLTTHRASSGQFKVLRDGCWKKVNFERPGVQHNRNDGSASHSFVASPWIQHYRSGSKSSVLASCSVQDNASSKEMSGQNFVDEERGEKTASIENAATRS